MLRQRDRPTHERRDRGLAIGFVAFFAILVISAVLYTLFDPAIGQLVTSASDQASHSTAQDQIDLAEQIWGLVLFFAVFLAFLFVIARAVFEQRRVG